MRTKEVSTLDQAFELYRAWRLDGDVKAYKQLLELGFDVIDEIRKLNNWDDALVMEVDPDNDRSAYL